MIKSILNNLIRNKVTRDVILNALDVDDTAFTDQIASFIRNGDTGNDERYLAIISDDGEDPVLEGWEVFRLDFFDEGWCKTDLRDILDTLFHLKRALNDYAGYWF